MFFCLKGLSVVFIVWYSISVKQAASEEMMCCIRLKLTKPKREKLPKRNKRKTNKESVPSERKLDQKIMGTWYEENEREKHDTKTAVSEDVGLEIVSHLVDTSGSPESTDDVVESFGENVDDSESVKDDNIKRSNRSGKICEADITNVLTCGVCGKKFENGDNLRIHLDSAHFERRITSKDELKQLQVANRFPCEICGKTFKGKHKERHMKTHLNTEKKFKCSECGVVFTKELERIKHKHEVHGKCPTCTLCGKTFQYQNTLNLHMIRQHGQRTEFNCDVCGVGFSIKSKLLRHKNVHEGLKSYQCATCGKVFKSVESLCGHKAVHSSEPKLECLQCGAKFRSKYNLVEVHTTSHTKNYCCDQCGKGFKRAENLKAHKELHLEERKYKCQLCGKSYNIKRGLMVHMLAHNDIKNYHCDLCGKSYRTNSSLKQHMGSHSKQLLGI